MLDKDRNCPCGPSCEGAPCGRCGSRCPAWGFRSTRLCCLGFMKFRCPETQKAAKVTESMLFPCSDFLGLGRYPNPNECGILSTNSQGLGAQIDRESTSTMRAPTYGCQARNSNRRVFGLVIGTIRDYVGVMEKNWKPLD